MKPNIRPVQDIISEEVVQAVLKMKMGKAAELSRVPIKAIRISGVESVLARIDNSMMYGDRMPESWRSVLISL